MRLFLPALALVAAAAAPAAAKDLVCAEFANLSSEQQIAAVSRIEPKSVEAPGEQTKISGGGDSRPVRRSSGAGGTVDPAMLETTKVAAVLGACDSNMNKPVAEAMAVAFAKPAKKPNGKAN